MIRITNDITDHQVQTLAILMNKFFGSMRKQVLFVLYGVMTSRDLNGDQAHQLIRKLEIAEETGRMYEINSMKREVMDKSGQIKMF